MKSDCAPCLERLDRIERMLAQLLDQRPIDSRMNEIRFLSQISASTSADEIMALIDEHNAQVRRASK